MSGEGFLDFLLFVGGFELLTIELLLVDVLLAVLFAGWNFALEFGGGMMRVGGS